MFNKLNKRKAKILAMCTSALLFLAILLGIYFASNIFVSIDESSISNIESSNPSSFDIRYAVENIQNGVYSSGDEAIGTTEEDKKSETTTEIVDESQKDSDDTTVVMATITGTGKAIGEPINGWLQLYDGPTLNGEAYTIKVGDSMPNKNNWSAWGSTRSLNNSSKAGNLEKSYGRIEKKIGIYNTAGRHWCAFGPLIDNSFVKESNTNGFSGGILTYGKNVDAVVEDSQGKRYYIPCAWGDIKYHTYTNGLWQTGYSWSSPHKLEAGNTDSSIVEFYGLTKHEDLKGFSAYKIVELIVYKE